jgi:hypothetical protein
MGHREKSLHIVIVLVSAAYFGTSLMSYLIKVTIHNGNGVEPIVKIKRPKLR